MVAENDYGLIAETYEQLQGLPILREARKENPLPKASSESTLQAIFQAAEIALLNITNLIERASPDIDQCDFGAASVKMSWVNGFHDILVRLGTIVYQLGISYKHESSPKFLNIYDSPTSEQYLEVLKHFDYRLLQQIKNDSLRLESILGDRSTDLNECNLLHLIRIGNHQATIWEKKLIQISLPIPVSSYSYEEFVGTSLMRKAVYDNTLKGDTYFTQFRGLHQIPEILGEEINDHLESAILDIRENHLQMAFEHLSQVNILGEGILCTMPPMVMNLSTSDYHRIRENLGLTSGSHSVSLHYHLFRDLYQQLWRELVNYLSLPIDESYSESDVEEMIRAIAQKRFSDPQAWIVHLIFNECLKLRNFIEQWRETHLHLARNLLGGSLTKSLSGSRDAVQAVKQMRDAALEREPMRPLLQARNLPDPKIEEKKTIFARYFASEASLDYHIQSVTGNITQRRFKEVQEQSGFFAKPCPFSPPPYRKV